MSDDFARVVSHGQNSRETQTRSPKMNVVPYIDVMLVLLVIFMVTAPMLNQGVKVDLPKVSSEALPQDNNAQVLTISIKADKTYYWNMGDEVDAEQGRETGHDSWCRWTKAGDRSIILAENARARVSRCRSSCAATRRWTTAQ